MLRLSNNISDGTSQDLDATQETRNDDDEVRNMMQSQSSDIPIASYSSSSSNNVLNTNLSGSLKRFNRYLRPSINENDSDDGENDAENYHDCSGASQTIFAPISSSQPIINPYNGQTAIYSRNEAATSHQRIAVAALPNLDFDPMTARTFSASTPSINSQHQPSGSANSTDENGQRQRDFIRNTTASSSNYFV